MVPIQGSAVLMQGTPGGPPGDPKVLLWGTYKTLVKPIREVPQTLQALYNALLHSSDMVFF